jgi:nitrogen fixation protein NifB
VVGAKIYPWIFWKHRRIRGMRAAEILIARQQQGLEMLVERGVLVKVNSVMIPGVNDQHLQEVSRVVKQKGAFLHNVMPLIAEAEHGTYYGLTGQRGPAAAELQALQDACGGDMNMMRHCRQCRADAVGLLGEDRGAEFTMDKVEAMDIDYQAAMSQRAAVHRTIETTRDARHDAAPQPIPATTQANTPPLLLAVATAGGGLVNQHFGHAQEFLVYEVSPRGSRLVGHRKVERYCTGNSTCGDHASALEGAIRALEGCTAVLCAQVGPKPWKALEAAGIQPIDDHAMDLIDEALPATYAALTAGAPVVELAAD